MMKIYDKSICEHEAGEIYMARGGDGRDLLFFAGAFLPLDHASAELLRSELPWTAPSRVLSLPRTFGTGDRLGIAGPGHVRCFRSADAAPVLAQQSVRELTFTGRTFADVLDAATFAVFREGFRRPWGFDGDHLKTSGEIESALRSGCTMITIDCSEKIGRGGEPSAEQRALYLGRRFEAEGCALEFGAEGLGRCTAVYGAAIEFICGAYEKYLAGGAADFEISIDETGTPTTPLEHFFVASELRRRGVRFQTLAPRFGGEFQKGVDYRGSLSDFEAELQIHAAVARSFGYKLSIHSGSDKLSIFPMIARHTQGRFHVKTSGTSWLEAMRLAAMMEPALYRRIHALALSEFGEAKKHYHVSADLSKIPEPAALDDAELSSLLDMDDARQLIHIAYGPILKSEYRESLYSLWREHEEDYFALLAGHLGRHLRLLGIG